MANDQFQVEFGIFMARYSIDGTKGPPFDGGHVRTSCRCPTAARSTARPTTTPATARPTTTRTRSATSSARARSRRTTKTAPCPFRAPARRRAAAAIAVRTAASRRPSRPVRSRSAWVRPRPVGPEGSRRCRTCASASTCTTRRCRPTSWPRTRRTSCKGADCSTCSTTLASTARSTTRVPADEMAPYVGIAGPLFTRSTARAATSKTTVVFRPRPRAIRSARWCSSSPAKPKDEHGGSLGDPNYGLQLQDRSPAT